MGLGLIDVVTELADSSASDHVLSCCAKSRKLTLARAGVAKLGHIGSCEGVERPYSIIG